MPHDERDDYDDRPGRPRATPEALLRSPASILSAFALIQFALSIVSILGSLGVTIVYWVDPGLLDDFNLLDAGLFAAASVLMAGLNLFLVRATAGMKRFHGYKSSCAAAALMMLAVPFCYFAVVTWPVGIWALVVLHRSDVRARFAEVRSNANRGTA